MNKSWIKDLPELVTAGVISEETARHINNYYQKKNEEAPNTFTIILGILGAVLVGCGILLVVAHNWDELSVTVKTALSLLPLFISQLACAYTLFKKKGMAWRESCSLFLFFAIGASISLISQIYQVNGSLSGFLLTWVLLALPLVYILSATTVALFCIAGITWYASDTSYIESYSGIPIMYAVVLLLLVPHYYKQYKNHPEGNFYHWLNWFSVVSISIALARFGNKEPNMEEWLFQLYGILFCIYYFIGRTPFFESKRMMANPFLITGTMGIIVTLLAWSFNFIWNGYKVPQLNQVVSNPLFYIMTAGLIMLFTLAWQHYRLQIKNIPDPLGFSCIFLLVLLIFLPNNPSLAVFLVNAWILFIGIFFIRKGSAINHLGIVNFGLTIIGALAICRFFDDRIPFIWRGIFFVGTGVAFFTANYLLLRKRKRLPATLNNK